MGLYPAHIEAALVGVPRGPKSKIFLVSTLHGSDDNDGLSWGKPLATIAAAEDLCTTLHNDVVLVLGEGTSFSEAALVWDKSYCHLIGLNAGGPEPRSRLKCTAALATTPFVTFSGSGCVVRNMSFWHETTDAAGLVNVLVSGGRNLFEGCQFAGGIGTNNSAGARSLKVGGANASGNRFKDCWIGNDTIQSVTDNVPLEFVTGAMHNIFDDCIFPISAGATTNTHVIVATSAGVGRLNLFRRCLFVNQTATAQVEVFGITQALAAANRILALDCWMYGVTEWNHAHYGLVTNITIAANTTGVTTGNLMMITSG
jgi:hypothetical protein